MSALKNIVFFMFCFQLCLQVVNNIEIQPGVYLNTGQVSPGIDTSSLIYQITNTMNSTAQNLNNIGTSGGPNLVTYNFNLLAIMTYSATVNLTDTVAGLPTGMLVGIVYTIFALAVAGIDLAFFGFLLLIGLLLSVTVGAIPFYTSLFSLIDPVLGTLLGTVIGGIQMMYILWGLIDYISKLISGAVKDIPV